MTEIMATPQLLSLPPELIQHVLRFLEPLDLAQIAQTCKRLHTHSCDDQIWQPLVNRNVSEAITDPKPLSSFRDLYVAFHPHWFLTRNKIWFADSQPSGKLLICRYDHTTASIVGYAVAATRGTHTMQIWEKDSRVIIHSFDPKVCLDLNQPVLKLDSDSPRTDDQPNHHPSDRAYAPPSWYSKEILMDTFYDDRLHGSFMFCRWLPEEAMSEGTRLWPPLRFPASARTRNDTRDGFNSAGHRPTRLSEVSQNNFRLRKWVEYNGHRSGPSMVSPSPPNALSAALGMAGSYFMASIRDSLNGGVSIRLPEDITTYASIPEWCYTPTTEKPWQGIWCGDYSGHGCEFLIIQQPNIEDERPLPRGMDWLQQWFRGEPRRSSSSSGSYASAQEEANQAVPALDTSGVSERSDQEVRPRETVANGLPAMSLEATRQDVSAYTDGPSGRLEALKLTGDPNIPRGEYTFVAPDIGLGGFVRVADEALFRGARVVRSAGHIHQNGVPSDEYIPSQLIMISHDMLAQFWEGYGHISFYRRVDLDALMRYNGPAKE